MTDLYTLTSIREFVNLLAGMLSIAFPSDDYRIIVKEGGLTDDKPLAIEVAVVGVSRSLFLDIDAVEVVIKPQVFLDQVDHGGTVSKADYTAGVFQQVVGRLIDKARDPNEMLRQVNANLTHEAAMRGIEAPVIDVMPERDN